MSPMPIAHTMASLLQVQCFLAQELPRLASHPLPHFLGQPHFGAPFPLALNAKKELSSYRLVWIWARYLKIHGWERKGEV